MNRKLLFPKGSGKTKIKSREKRRKARKKTKRVLKKRGKCVPCCIYPRCKAKRHGRGLCKRHYGQAMRQLKKLSERKRKSLEKDLIKRNLLLPKGRVKNAKMKKTDSESTAFKLGSKIRGSLRRK